MTENSIVNFYPFAQCLSGRQKIVVNKSKIDETNIIEVLDKALAVDMVNVREINYLYNVYRGIMDIQGKTKKVRPENNNKVTINIPNKIVTFKSAFLLARPIQYISVNSDKDISEEIIKLNSLMASEDKESKDKECADWIHICGVAPRIVLPEPDNDIEGSPAAIYTLDPREAFVIYSSGIGKKPIAGVLKQFTEDNKRIYYVYVPNGRYTILENEITEYLEYDFGRVPIVEYINNEARLGAFEVVLSPINMINTLESSRVDNVVDFVNAYDVFQNCEITPDTYKMLSEGGQCINIASRAGYESKVYRISSELSQSGVQTELNALYSYINEITGMPNRNGGSSTSDTGAATMLRDGWQDAESRANDTEKLFIRSEKEILKLILKIYRDKGILNLDYSDVMIQFTRKNLTDVQSKAQVLCEMLNNSKISPIDAYVTSELFADPEAACRRGLMWMDEQDAKLEESLEMELNGERSVHDHGQGDSVFEEEINTTIQES